MKLRQAFLFPIHLAIAFGFLTLSSAQEFSEQGKDSQMQKKSELSKKAWAELSEPEREKVREALRAVWADSRVLMSRANVNRAVEEYKAAVKESIASQDPETAKLLEKIQHTGLLQSTIGGGPGGHKRGGPMGHGPRSLDQIMSFPQMYEKMSDQQKQAFLVAAKQAKADPKVTSALEEWKKLRKEDEVIRRDQYNAVRKYRRAYLEKVLELAPELADVVDPDAPPKPPGGKGAPRKRQKGEKGEKGKK